MTGPPVTIVIDLNEHRLNGVMNELEVCELS